MTPPRNVVALASLTLREGVRARVPWLVAAFAAFLVFVTPFLSGGGALPLERMRMLESLALGLSGALLALAAVFLGARPLSEDVASRRIYTVVTKPVGPGGLVAGRWFGQAALLAFLAAGFWLSSVLYVGLAARRAVPDGRERAAGLDGHAFLEPEAVVGTPRAPAEAMAFYRGDVFRWRFGALPADAGTAVWFRLQPGPRTNRHLAVRVRFENPARGAHAECEAVLPLLEPGPVVVPAGVVFPGEPLLVSLESDDLDSALVQPRRAMALGVVEASFPANLARAFALLWMRSLLVLTVALAGSTVLSYPVAASLALAVFLAGHMAGLAGELLTEAGVSDSGHAHGVRAAIEGLWAWVRAGGAAGEPEWLRPFLALVVDVVPDFGRLDGGSFVTSGRVVPASLLAGALEALVLFRALPLLLGGGVAFRFRELGS